MNNFKRFLRNAAKAAKEQRDSEILKKAHIELKKAPSSPRSPRAPDTQSPGAPEPQTPEPPITELHKTLSEEGVPPELSQKMHHVITKHSDPGAKELLGGAVKKAI